MVGAIRTEQRGARWLAQQQREIGAATLRHVAEEGVDPAHEYHSNQPGPPRYHLTDCMCSRALVNWFLILREYGRDPHAERCTSLLPSL
jgi:hypothetical protein